MEVNRNSFIEGKQVYLRPLIEEDIKGNYRNWLNDAEVTLGNSHGRLPMTEEKLLKYVRSVQDSDSCLVLAVIDKATTSHIGNISLQKINWIDRNAEIAFLLGEKAYHGKGVMNEAGRLLINHAFDVMNLYRIYCGTIENNAGMRKLALNLGMKEEGVRREGVYKNGAYLNVIEFGLLKREYNSNEVL